MPTVTRSAVSRRAVRWFSNPRLAIATWFAAATALVVVFFVAFVPQYAGDRAASHQARPSSWIQSDLLALLPAERQDPLQARASEQLAGDFDRTLIWLVRGRTPADAAEHGRRLTAELERIAAETGLFAAVNPPPADDPTERYRALFAHRFKLLRPDDFRALSDNPQQFLADARAALFSPLATARVASLERDPLFTFGRYLGLDQPPPLDLIDGIPVTRSGAEPWALIRTTHAATGFSLANQGTLLQAVNTLTAQAESAGSTLLVTGLPLYATRGAASAQREVSTVGLGSLIGVIVLLLGTFRSPRPLLLSLLSIGTGIGAGLMVTLIVFGHAHVLTLVFGASLVGVSIDYALHLMADGFGSPDWRAQDGLAHVLVPTAIGLLTSSVAYLCLAWAPFPGLQQMAVFSAAGLAAAWLTVMCLFPSLLRGFQPSHAPAALRLAHWWQAHWPQRLRRRGRLLIPLVTALLLIGLLRIAPNDDVRQLQSLPPDLTAMERGIRAVLPPAPSPAYLLVRGDSQSDVFQRERAARDALEQIPNSTIDALSAHFPSAERQRATHALFAELYAPATASTESTPSMREWLTQIGMAPAVIDQALQVFSDSPTEPISLSDWLKSAPEQLRAQWLGCDAELGCASVIRIFGQSNTDDFAALASQLPGVSLIDPAATISEVLQRYRHRALWLIGAALSAVVLLLSLLLNLRLALQIVAVPGLAAVTALAVLGLVGAPISLFNILALLLIIGVGIDYAVFFALAENRRDTTGVAVLLSSTTTLLAFGLLALSATQAVHAFGLTLALGILAALLVAPLLGSRPAR